MNYWTEGKDYIYVAGHRGFPEKYPENTMESFRAAIEAGVDQIETDVRVTKDDELVLIHNGEEIYTSEKITAVVNRFKVTNGILKADAFLKSPVFSYCEKPELYIVKDGKREKLELTHSECEKYHAEQFSGFHLPQCCGNHGGYQQTEPGLCGRTGSAV
jgi:glycerophosphoryl diester phosphodiesterase